MDRPPILRCQLLRLSPCLLLEPSQALRSPFRFSLVLRRLRVLAGPILFQAMRSRPIHSLPNLQLPEQRETRDPLQRRLPQRFLRVSLWLLLGPLGELLQEDKPIVPNWLCLGLRASLQDFALSRQHNRQTRRRVRGRCPARYGSDAHALFYTCRNDHRLRWVCWPHGLQCASLLLRCQSLLLCQRFHVLKRHSALSRAGALRPWPIGHGGKNRRRRLAPELGGDLV